MAHAKQTKVFWFFFSKKNKKKKVFFFEKKNQKTFVCWVLGPWGQVGSEAAGYGLAMAKAWLVVLSRYEVGDVMVGGRFTEPVRNFVCEAYLTPRSAYAEQDQEVSRFGGEPADDPERAH